MIFKNKLDNLLLCLLLCIGSFQFVYANTLTGKEQQTAGIVFVASGETKAIKEGQAERVLQRGNSVYQGETLVTGDNSKLLVRLSDNTVVSLRPASRVVLDKFVYQKDAAADNKATVKLAKGGAHIITGLIGKKTPANFTVTTPVGIIGVRGTDFTAILANLKLFVAVWNGQVSLTNSAGTLIIGDKLQYKNGVISGLYVHPQGLTYIPVVIRICQ